MNSYVLGIDPGKKGGIAALGLNKHLIKTYSIEKLTETDISSLIYEFKSMGRCFGFIEKVHAFPGQGVTSMFTFGQNYGFWRGLLIAYKIPFEEIPPILWQKSFGIIKKPNMTKPEFKNMLKQKAQQLFCDESISLSTADALLIAEYGRRLLNIRKVTL